MELHRVLSHLRQRRGEWEERKDKIKGGGRCRNLHWPSARNKPASRSVTKNKTDRRQEEHEAFGCSGEDVKYYNPRQRHKTRSQTLTDCPRPPRNVLSDTLRSDNHSQHNTTSARCSYSGPQFRWLTDTNQVNYLPQALVTSVAGRLHSGEIKWKKVHAGLIWSVKIIWNWRLDSPAVNQWEMILHLPSHWWRINKENSSRVLRLSEN